MYCDEFTAELERLVPTRHNTSDTSVVYVRMFNVVQVAVIGSYS